MIMHKKVIIEEQIYEPVGIIESRSRGKEYQLRRPGKEGIVRVCHCPLFDKPTKQILKTHGERIQYIP